MGLFSSSKTSVSNVTQNTTDSNNRTSSRTDIIADSGNTTATIYTGGGAAGGLGGVSGSQIWTVAGVVLVVVAAALWLNQNRKPWE